jgi:tRNA(fMet)-specific endonuclease VapC
LVCADTSFIIALERREPDALQKVQELEDKGEVVYTTAVTVAELYRGAYGSKGRAKALKDAKDLLDLFATLRLDYESGRMWGELAHSMKSDTIGDRDLFIASIALANKQPLITRNRKHFERVPGLQVEGW